jgi:hypothetical protein
MRTAEFARRRARIEFESRTGRRNGKRAFRALVKRANAVTIISGGRVVGYRLKDGVVCNRLRFTTADQAARELFRIGTFAKHAYIPTRAYRCDFCNGYHLARD